PQSDDIEVGSRDVRDVTEENISKAQILYNIIASTYKKDFNKQFYGQRHLAFEIVAMRGFIYFYAAVPVSLVEIIKQAVVSAYPAAQLEEVEEHNIFNRVGKINATVGGELILKESFIYPIATYQDLKRDALQSLLNSLSSLSKEDGVGIQIELRPADPAWQKTSKKAASNKRKGKKDSAGFGRLMRDLATTFVKAHSEGNGDKKPESLSGLEQATVDAIEDKSRYPGFEVLIRVVASSNIESRSQSLLANVIAAFQLFDAPGKNGFKYKPAEDMQQFVSDYIMRFFIPQKRPNILNSVELATIFHFPDQNNIPTSQLTRQESKQVDGPRNIPDEGLMLGYNVFRGVKKPIRLALADRQRHIYAVGQTGTGKSTFLENLALQDMLSGNGFAFVDPHGDTVDKLLAMVPRERTEDIIYFSPAETDYPMGLNLFEYNTPDQKDFLIQEVLNMLYKLYDPQHQGIMGPRYENIFRNCALAIMADPNGGTFVDVPKLFRDPNFLKQKLQHVTDQNVLDYWLKEYPASQRSNEAGEVTAW
ncbi:MAG: ATP-binding protein, partial [Candidatus Saccharimonadales bacterium]